MHPRIHIANIRHLKQVGVQPRTDENAAEGALMGFGGTRSNNNPRDAVLANGILNICLGIASTGKHLMIGKNHIGQSMRIGDNSLNIHHARDVAATVANKDANPRGFRFGNRFHLG
ncbi:MAG: hypothetical protein BWY63_03566 [Chloroflexi bacterium ADurb.Bin360]|nr:MAG: hypothetical protein BWY63_03566 [Chloroflexi bacterium ADurb.Bin360]